MFVRLSQFHKIDTVVPVERQIEEVERKGRSKPGSNLEYLDPERSATHCSCVLRKKFVSLLVLSAESYQG